MAKPIESSTLSAPASAPATKTRTETIAVIGLGYVGLPLAIRAAEKGFSVVGFDIDAAKIATIKDASVPHITPRETAALRETERLLATDRAADLAGATTYTVYYAGVRVDGTVVIKKKKNGTYTTLAQKAVFPGSYVDGEKTNLLPHGTWLSLKTETVTNGDGSVTVRLFLKKPGESSFTKVLEAKDASNPITTGGYMGIRTDFMDVEFDNVKATKI